MSEIKPMKANFAPYRATEPIKVFKKIVESEKKYYTRRFTSPDLA